MSLRDRPAPPGGSARLVAEAVQLWLLPTVGLGGAVAWWRALGLEGATLAAALALPAVVSSLVVALGAGAFGMWRVTVPYTTGGVPPWIGAVYAGTLALALAAVAAVVGPGAFGGSWAGAAAGGALGGGAAGVAYDVAAVRAGLLVPPAAVRGERGLSAWAAVRRYGPPFFGGIGAVCGLGLWAATRTLAPDAPALRVAGWLAVAGPLGAAPFWVALVLRRRRDAREDAAAGGAA